MDLTDPKKLQSWREWFSGRKPKETVPLAHDVLESATAFETDMRRLAKPEEIRQFETNGTKEQLSGLASTELTRAQEVQSSWRTRRNTGLRKFPKKLQSFMKTFSDFLTCYSGIVEIVQQADNQFGGLAYSTLSLFLIVAVNKSQQEEKIQTTLDGLCLQLSRLAKLHDLVPTQEVALLVSNVYGNVIKFARSSILYYKRSSIGRVFCVTIRPAKLYIDKEIEAINQDVGEIEKEASVRSQQRIHKLEVQQDEDRLLRDKQWLWRLHPYLGPIDVSTSERDEFRAALQDPSETPKRLQNFNFEELCSNLEYSTWKAKTHSSLLLLRGETRNTRSGLSWLSLASLDLLDLLEKEDGHSIAYSFVKTTAWMTKEVLVPSHIVISRMIWQLLQQKPQILREPANFEALQNRIRSEEWQQPNPREPCRVLAEILAEFPKTYLVLDCIDYCVCSPVTFVERLLEVVRDSKTIVKIFVVIGGIKTFDIEDVTITIPSDIFHVITMDQGKRKVAD